MTPLAVLLWALAAFLVTLGVILVAGSYGPMIPPPPVPVTPPAPAPAPVPPDTAPPAPSPTSQSFRVLAVEPAPHSYGKSHYRLTEYDPAAPDRVFMGSVALEAAEVGVFAGLRAGDVVTVSTSTSGTGKGEGGRL